MKKLILLLCFPFILFGQEINHSHPEEVAKIVLNAFKSKDLKQLLTVSHGSNKEMISDILKEGENHPRYSSLFSGWRWDAANNWKGQLYGVIEVNDKRKKVKFYS